MLHYVRYKLKPKFLNSDYKNYLIKNLNKSPYYGSSKEGDLNNSVFNPNHVYGFSIIFRKDHLNCVKEKFPYLSEYLDKIILPGTNCYYVNYLVIKKGKKVKTHIDDTLSGYFKSNRKKTENAKYVSVLYLIISPRMKGGELNIKMHKNKFIKRKYNIVKPEDNMLVTFDGNLYHSVNKFKKSKIRASLICEQYELSPEEMKSMKGFIILDQNNNKKISICNSSQH